MLERLELALYREGVSGVDVGGTGPRLPGRACPPHTQKPKIALGILFLSYPWLGRPAIGIALMGLLIVVCFVATLISGTARWAGSFFQCQICPQGADCHYMGRDESFTTFSALQSKAFSRNTGYSG